MRVGICLFMLNFISLVSFADTDVLRHPKDSTNIYRKVDTTYIENFRDFLNVKLVFGQRHNTFGFSNKLTKESIEYSMNAKVNFGIAMSFKAIGFELSYSPKALNQNDAAYGKSTQFALATGGSTRKFIYDVYFRYSEGFHTTAKYKFGSDTVESFYKRPDIINQNIGFNVMYVFNNKRFSSSAPYSMIQKQKRNAGSFLLGLYGFVYAIDADTIIFPDTLYKQYSSAVQFRSAASSCLGISFGYTYTIKFFKNWFFNIATIPGVNMQEFYSLNAFDKSEYRHQAFNISLQSKYSLGYSRKKFFIGMSYIDNSFIISDDPTSSLKYKFGSFRLAGGYRFDLRKLLKKKL